jgi:branched-chain amino acid transport system substrate-binding protein
MKSIVLRTEFAAKAARHSSSEMEKQRIMKQRLALRAWSITTFLLVILHVSLACNKREPQAPHDLRIGAILPLTGDAAVWGQNVKKGIDLALAELNAAGGVRGRQLFVVYEDSQGLPRIAVTALNKMIDADHVPAIIGDVASSSVLSMAPIAEKQQVVLLSPGASNADITTAGQFVFRNWHSDSAEGKYLANVAHDRLQKRRLAIIYVNNAYGKGLEQVFSKRFKDLGGTIATSEAFAQNATDFRAQLLRIKNSDCDGIFMPGYPKEMPEVLKQARELALRRQFLCPSAFEDQQSIDLAGTAAEGVIYVYPRQGDLSRSHVARFYKAYRDRYGVPPGALSDTGYDALRLMAMAIETSGISGPAIRDGLLKIKDYPGVAGDTTFDQNGDIVKEFVLKTVEQGKFVEYRK